MDRIKQDYKALGVQVNSTGAQVIFPSVLLLGGKKKEEIDIWCITSDYVSGAGEKALVFMTMGLSVKIINC